MIKIIKENNLTIILFNLSLFFFYSNISNLFFLKKKKRRKMNIINYNLEGRERGLLRGDHGDHQPRVA
eukprot:m.38785 g.38785  ORF g.38785 m.38785 type:complete len:68 (+) comp6817_c1_seq2:579-782(+)